MTDTNIITTPLTRKDFVSNQEVRWCPGCGDYAILSQVQKFLPSLGIPKEKFLFVSGIGCSSRFPYYMDTYGFHSIHGRATAIASGAKVANPDLSVWVVTGDGDAMSIGGNHFIHTLRRNIDMNILMFNNRIYGLTKGQYSPTSELGKISKSTPMGSLDYPFNPPALALGAGGTFIARAIDRDQAASLEILERAAKHKGTSFVEYYQNCLIFNDGAYSDLTQKDSKDDTVLHLVHNQPMLFGKEKNKGLRLVGSQFEIIELGPKYGINDVFVHNENDKNLAMLLSELTYSDVLPTPVGIFYVKDTPTYETMVTEQIEKAIKINGQGDLDKLFNSGGTWVVE
ncbi:MAG: 2-oxoacid:ferredoxin oxidoreductase subunit beta [Fidelibacterota bacterium]